MISYLIFAMAYNDDVLYLQETCFRAASSFSWFEFFTCGSLSEFISRQHGWPFSPALTRNSSLSPISLTLLQIDVVYV